MSKEYQCAITLDIIPACRIQVKQIRSTSLINGMICRNTNAWARELPCWCRCVSSCFCSCYFIDSSDFALIRGDLIDCFVDLNFFKLQLAVSNLQLANDLAKQHRNYRDSY